MYVYTYTWAHTLSLRSQTEAKVNFNFIIPVHKKDIVRSSYKKPKSGQWLHLFIRSVKIPVYS